MFNRKHPSRRSPNWHLTGWAPEGHTIQISPFYKGATSQEWDTHRLDGGLNVRYFRASWMDWHANGQEHLCCDWAAIPPSSRISALETQWQRHLKMIGDSWWRQIDFYATIQWGDAFYHVFALTRLMMGLGVDVVLCRLNHTNICGLEYWRRVDIWWKISSRN